MQIFTWLLLFGCASLFAFLTYLSCYFLLMAFEFQLLMQDMSWRMPLIKIALIAMAFSYELIFFKNLVFIPFLMLNDVNKWF